MAGSADAAKNALESLFNKTKEVVHSAAETTKGYANVAIGKIMPGQQGCAQPADPRQRKDMRTLLSARLCPDNRAVRNLLMYDCYFDVAV
ncbi:hypothetical protein Tcan_14410 [Toxocara canis]|uniref:Uncharacterized protein n=1 Tax=Toxocara canis TaxID=6265 RepID=A0A0B2VQ01_TOXCA|nr:hypothetical protein Tcan_14410 [Toxocara canis]